MQVGIQLYLLQTTIICMCVFQCLIDVFPGFVKIIFVFIKQQSNILQCQTLIVSRHYIANGSKQQITPLLLPQFIVAVSLRQSVCCPAVHAVFRSDHLHCLIQ